MRSRRTLVVVLVLALLGAVGLMVLEFDAERPPEALGPETSPRRGGAGVHQVPPAPPPRHAPMRIRTRPFEDAADDEIRIHLVDEASAALLAGASIIRHGARLRQLTEEDIAQEWSGDGHGRFALDAEEVGGSKGEVLTARAPSYLPRLIDPRELDAQGVHVVPLQRGAGRELRFVTQEGRPLPGVRVRLSMLTFPPLPLDARQPAAQAAGDPTAGIFTAWSDEGGVVKLTGLPADDYFVRIHHAAHIPDGLPKAVEPFFRLEIPGPPRDFEMLPVHGFVATVLPENVDVDVSYMWWQAWPQNRHDMAWNAVLRHFYDDLGRRFPESDWRQVFVPAYAVGPTRRPVVEVTVAARGGDAQTSNLHSSRVDRIQAPDVIRLLHTGTPLRLRVRFIQPDGSVIRQPENLALLLGESATGLRIREAPRKDWTMSLPPGEFEIFPRDQILLKGVVPRTKIKLLEDREVDIHVGVFAHPISLVLDSGFREGPSTVELVIESGDRRRTMRYPFSSYDFWLPEDSVWTVTAKAPGFAKASTQIRVPPGAPNCRTTHTLRLARR